MKVLKHLHSRFGESRPRTITRIKYNPSVTGLCIQFRIFILTQAIYQASTMPSETMRAVVLKGVKNVAVEERPIPTIQDPKDIIVKVRYTALCGR